MDTDKLFRKTVGGKDAGAEAKGTKGCCLIVFSGCME